MNKYERIFKVSRRMAELMDEIDAGKFGEITLNMMPEESNFLRVKVICDELLDLQEITQNDYDGVVSYEIDHDHGVVNVWHVESMRDIIRDLMDY